MWHKVDAADVEFSMRRVKRPVENSQRKKNLEAEWSIDAGMHQT